MALTERTQARITTHFTQHDLSCATAIDATCGQGKDTEFLARLGFGKVISLDIQQSAVDATKHRIQEARLENVEILKISHQHLRSVSPDSIDCVMFNFGYLPNGDKTITTQADTSLIAAQMAFSILDPKGIISLLCYPGHPAGLLEMNELKDWLSSIDGDWLIETHLASAPKHSAPVLFVIRPK